MIISGGGTGGHIFPAIAIANALKKIMNGNIDILFVGATGRMEMEKVPAAGYPIEGLRISGLQRRLTFANLTFPFKVLSSLVRAGQIINRFRPDAVVGVGGYASGPVLYMAVRKKIPSLIQEQNSFPGITNKLLAKKVNRICVAYEGMEKYFPKEKVMLTGNPVRQDILNLEGKKARGLEEFGLKEGKKIVLVIGGSLGARTINESILAGLPLLRKNNIQLIWQTGKSFFPAAREAVDSLKEEGIVAHEFINKMDYAYAAADLVISRAGASSVSELCLVKKPVILVPSPNVAEDHQTKNAIALVNRHAAILVSDADAKKKLILKAAELLKDEPQCRQLRQNIEKLGFTNAADAIAYEVLNLIRNKN